MQGGGGGTVPLAFLHLKYKYLKQVMMSIGDLQVHFPFSLLFMIQSVKKSAKFNVRIYRFVVK